MSVAFRRDSDEEHREPRFELPIPAGPNWVTPRGLALIEQKRAELGAAVEAEADAERLEALRRELRYWHTRHATAVLAAAPAPGEAGIGSRVSFRLANTTRDVEIVGGDEADPAAGRIAFHAPIARALISAGVGDRVDFGGREEAIEVLAVAP